MYGCCGRANSSSPRRQLDDLAEVHHGDAVAEELDRGEVVGDEQAREAELLLQVAQQVEDGRLHGDVERRHRLVGDQQARRDAERPREADALALPARELVRVAVAQLGAQPDRVEELDHAPVERGAAGEPVQPQRLADDLAAGHPRVERRVRVLEDDVDLRAGTAAARAATGA